MLIFHLKMLTDSISLHWWTDVAMGVTSLNQFEMENEAAINIHRWTKLALNRDFSQELSLSFSSSSDMPVLTSVSRWRHLESRLKYLERIPKVSRAVITMSNITFKNVNSFKKNPTHTRGCPVPHGNFMAWVEEICNHARTHGTETQKPYLHWRSDDVLCAWDVWEGEVNAT